MAAQRLSPRLLLQPVHLLALGFGAGLSPWAPGTMGSLLALPPAWLLMASPLALRVGIVAGVILAGVWICGESARRIGIDDHPAIVFDEIAAMLLLTIMIPAGIAWLAAGFVLFRLFDIVKPWPIRDMDHRLHGGIGIMLDDLAAALFAAICLWVVDRLLTVI